MKKLMQNSTPRHLQLALVLSTVGLALFSTVDMACRMLAQYPSNPNFSGFMMTLVSGFMFPAIVVLAAYVLISRKISVVQKLYESVIVAVVAVCLFALANYIFTGVLSYFLVYDPVWNALGSFWVYTVESLVPLALVLTYLLVARHKKQW